MERRPTHESTKQRKKQTPAEKLNLAVPSVVYDHLCLCEERNATRKVHTLDGIRYLCETCFSRYQSKVSSFVEKFR